MFRLCVWLNCVYGGCIIVFFFSPQLDISDEFKRVIETLRGHDDKIRVVLNQADMITHQQLLRVYGALMWSLGKVIKTPEGTWLVSHRQPLSLFVVTAIGRSAPRIITFFAFVERLCVLIYSVACVSRFILGSRVSSQGFETPIRG